MKNLSSAVVFLSLAAATAAPSNELFIDQVEDKLLSPNRYSRMLRFSNVRVSNVRVIPSALARQWALFRRGAASAERERERDECAEGTVALQADPIIARAWEIIEQSCPEAISKTASSYTTDYSVCPSTIFYNLKRACDAVNGK